MSKPREFWIYEGKANCAPLLFVYRRRQIIKKEAPEHFNELNVIEKSSYDALLAEAEKLVYSLEFYKNINNNHTFIFDNENDSRAEVYERYSKTSIGDLGIKAIEALESWTKFKEGIND